MPVSEALLRRSADPTFWAALRPGGAETTQLSGELRASFPVAGGYGLVLDVDLSTGEQSVGLRGPASSEPVQLGWAAADRPHPAALRWWELDLCARVIALDDPTLPHPGLVVALLSPFAPATPDDDAAEIAAVREAAYRSLRRNPGDLPADPGDLPEEPGPEQAPLPLFDDARWWPARPAPSAQVLDEAAIAAWMTPATTSTEVRSGPRFPHDDLTRMLELAAERLRSIGGQPCYAGVRPLARRIAVSGDLTGVPDLVGALTEAGCDHPTVLDALSEPLVPEEACWMVETLAGAAPGSLLRRRV